MAGRVEGKVAFVTGAGRAQGRAEAVRLAEEGADVIIVDVPSEIPGLQYETSSAEDLAETVRLVELFGRRAIAGHVDVRDLDALRAHVDRGVAELGRLDIVVANAGICIAGPWHTQTPDVLRTVLDVDLVGVYNTVWVSVNHLLTAGGGSVILTSSSNALKAGPFNLAYNAAKYGVVGLGKSFAMELAKDHIRVNVVHPGPVEAGMYGAFVGVEAGMKENPRLSGMVQGWMPGHMDPREIANAVLFLASDESTWATGASFAIDGGMSSY